MTNLETIGYLLFVGIQFAFILAVFWLVFYYAWKSWKEFRKS